MNWIEIIHEEEPKRYNRGYRKIWLQFKEEFPELLRRGTTYEPYGYMEILVSIPGKGKVVYNPVGISFGKLLWKEHWVDEKEIKQKELETKRREKEQRPRMYETFLSMVCFYQREYGATQEDIAKLSGFSRKSINEYMNGKSIPKVSTMRKICKSLGLNIDN